VNTPSGDIGFLFGLLLFGWCCWLFALSIMIPIMLSNIRDHLKRISEQLDRAVNRQEPLPPKQPLFVIPPKLPAQK
jgi:hypothetical protein